MSQSSPWEVRYHSAAQCYFLYIPAGIDPADGLPLTYATPLLPAESLLWQQGEHQALADRLRARSIPLPVGETRPGRWRRFLKELRRKLLGAK